MAHMDCMIIIYVWGMREDQNSKRAREKILNKAPREPMDAMCQMGLNWLSELPSILVRGRGVLQLCTVTVRKPPQQQHENPPQNPTKESYS